MPVYRTTLEATRAGRFIAEARRLGLTEGRGAHRMHLESRTSRLGTPLVRFVAFCTDEQWCSLDEIRGII